MAPRKSARGGVKVVKRDCEVNWPIKLSDGTPILRADISYDVLAAIFDDTHYKFTSPTGGVASFKDLYQDQVLSSPKMSQALRTKAQTDDLFGLCFLKLNLLINIGRINTTLAFYPTMKTALRSYHPIASLQQDEAARSQFQDAPRLKAILKGAIIDREQQQPIASLQAFATARCNPNVTEPVASVVSVLFLLFGLDATWASAKYMPHDHHINELIWPSKLSSTARAQGFLAILHRVMEHPAFINDFNDPSPLVLVQLSPELNPQNTNLDTQEELDYGLAMRDVRLGVVGQEPKFQKREEAIAKTLDRENMLDNDSVTDQPAGRRRIAPLPSRSHARSQKATRFEHGAFSCIDLAIVIA